MMSPYHEPSYQRISQVSFAPNGTLDVIFGNGDRVMVTIQEITPPSYTDIQWDQMTFNSSVIEVPAEPYPLDIPWDHIRDLTDPGFREYNQNLEIENSLEIGRRVRSLRESKNLSVEKLATKSGVAAYMIKEIEAGKMGAGFIILAKVLAGMGLRLKDLSTKPSTP